MLSALAGGNLYNISVCNLGNTIVVPIGVCYNKYICGVFPTDFFKRVNGGNKT